MDANISALERYKQGFRSSRLFSRMELQQPKRHIITLRSKWDDDAPSKQAHVLTEEGTRINGSFSTFEKYVDLWSCERYEVQ